MPGMKALSVKAFLSQAVVGRWTEACSQFLKSLFEQSALCGLDREALLEDAKGKLVQGGCEHILRIK